MTNEKIMQIALRQSAYDSACQPEDFLRTDPVVVLSQPCEQARRYLRLPFDADLCSYGHNVVASVSPELWDIVTAYVGRFPKEHCFETPNMLVLSEKLRPLGYDICFMAEYFLPDLSRLRALDCPFDCRVLTPEVFPPLYLPEWSNALCRDRKQLDRLAVGAFDGSRLVGLAGASADCDTMWQIGIDVLPEYRQKGVASALTSRLALEILDREIVPFYCCAWSNIASARNALRSGFYPAWANMTVKKQAFIDEMNGK